MPFPVPALAKPFTLHVPDKDLEEFKQLLQISKISPVTWESLQEDRRFGITHKWITESRDYWLNKYDWRAKEKHINSLPNYKMEIEGVNVHFIGLFSDKADAAPIVLMHGWPGSFVEFLPMVELVQSKYKPADQPCHFIVASLPGYPLSEILPTAKDWKMEDSARLIDTLMVNLGFEKYIAHGGDVGSFVAGLISRNYDKCIGSHQNLMVHAPQPAFEDLSSPQQKAVLRAFQWRKTGVAYAIEQGTRPSTIGYVLSSNPLAELAWIGEKFLEWSDQDPSLDDILTNVSLYWFTQAYPRSIYPYRAYDTFMEAQPYLNKPTGYSWFANELSPGIKAGVEKVCNLVTYKEHEHGGQFAALECPKELLEDLEEYVQAVWKTDSKASC